MIRKKTKAFLFFLHPPMRCVGTRGTMPVFVQTGRALYDVAGWLPAIIDEQKVARAIGIELKATKQRHPSLRIVGADGSGAGVQAHQLEALASVHRDGGVSCLVWCNGGVVGVLDGSELAKAWYDYGVSLAVEKLGKVPAKGSRSIPWGLFRQVDFNDKPESVIVPPAKEPTLKEALDAKRRKARKQIEAAEREKAEQEDNPGFIRDTRVGIDITDDPADDE